MSVLHWIVVGGIVWLLWKLLRPSPLEHDAAAQAELRADSQYSAEVVGESYHGAGFIALRRALGREAGDEAYAEAELLLDDQNPHDGQAVAVVVQGQRLGHLPRESAAAFRAAAKRSGARPPFKTKARVYFDEGKRSSVTLDLPSGYY